MNRRDFLSAGFKLGAAGLLLPVIEPVRKVWALDRTMIPAQTSLETEWFDTSFKSFAYDHMFVTTTWQNGQTNYWPTMPRQEDDNVIRVLGPKFTNAADMWAWYRDNQPEMTWATYLRIHGDVIR